MIALRFSKAYTSTVLPDTILSSPLSEPERNAVFDYSGPMGMQTNQVLRQGGRGAGIVRELDAAFTKSRLTQSMVVYRGISERFIKQLGGLRPGEVVEDAGFLSTTRSYRTAIKFSQTCPVSTNYSVVLSIRVDGGEPAVDVLAVANAYWNSKIHQAATKECIANDDKTALSHIHPHFGGEAEVLFPRRRSLQLVSVRESNFYTNASSHQNWDEVQLRNLYAVKADLIAPDRRAR